MTDPRRVADALAALADGTAPESVEHRTVVADAADAAADVRAAARFVARGGRGRLRLAVRAAERTGDRDAAERGRRTLETLAAFGAAAGPNDGDDAGSVAADALPTPATADRSLPPRSRNDFIRRRSTTSRRR